MKSTHTRQSSHNGSLRQHQARKFGIIINFIGRLFPSLAIYLLQRKWFSAAKYPYSSREHEMMRTARQGQLRHQRQSLHYYHWGDSGPLVILIHGWSGHAAQISGFVPGLLAQGFQVLALDAPAHGQSSGHKTDLFAISHAWQQLLRDYPTPHSIISHSFGGIVACYALRHQLLSTQKLVLISAPPSLEYLVNGYCHALRLRTALRLGFRRALARRYGANFWPAVAPEAIAADIKLPVLVCHDENDRVLPVALGQALCTKFPHARCLISRKLGHRRILSDTGTIKNVVEFIKES